jgi:UDP-glucuronate 4-epimerase
MKVLVTGSAGFIGSALSLRLLERGDIVTGVDNHNDYYDSTIKEARLARHDSHPKYTHLRIDLGDRKVKRECFSSHKPQRVVTLVELPPSDRTVGCLLMEAADELTG